MRPRKAFTTYTIGIACLFPSLSAAEPVEHHGSLVAASAAAGDCLVCHDGFIARFVGFCLTECPFGGAHAITKAYPPPGRRDYFRSAADVEGCGIVLVNGTVVCTSCHNLRNPEGVHLAVTICGSRLCLSCHIK